MTEPIPPMELFAMPAEAIELDPDQAGLSPRQMALAALQQAMRERQLGLPLGPQTALADADRLLSLNQVALQLATAGIVADEIPVDLNPWQQASTAPQLLLAALVDEENAVVAFPGALTAAEVVALAQQTKRAGVGFALHTEAFRGGVDRLLTLVQVLDSEALPRLALPPGNSTVVAVLDWLRGRLGEAMDAIGGELRPVSALAFRGGAVAPQADAQALAMLVIPFGLSADQLVSGDAARRCVRKFQLALIASGREKPTALKLQLSSAVPGALLPDGLVLVATQGSHRQTITSAMSTELELVFQASDQLLDVSLGYGDADPVVLPSLQLPA